jgi:hypothetical protein
MSAAMEADEIIEAVRAGRDVSAVPLDDIAWQRARPVRLTRYWSGEPAPEGRRAEARVLWSDDALHVRFVCPQSEPLVVSPTPNVERKTVRLWDRDVCEVFVAPDSDEPRRYFEFEVAPTGEWLDLAVEWAPEGRKTDWDFRSGMRAEARIGDGVIALAMHLPWASLGGRPEPGARWRANLYRCVGTDPTRGYVAWQPTFTPEPSFHAPDKFGWLHFTA